MSVSPAPTASLCAGAVPKHPPRCDDQEGERVQTDGVQDLHDGIDQKKNSQLCFACAGGIRAMR